MLLKWSSRDGILPAAFSQRRVNKLQQLLTIASMDYTPPSVDSIFVLLGCCCSLIGLKSFDCSAIEEYDVLCCSGATSCSCGGIKTCVKVTGACACLDTRIAIPCDSEVPCLLALCNLRCYEKKGMS
eukprot:TRINITY_DN5949_c0_g1_i1.p1 TRINITY_DN5949_c0_g1~~TRINITY_DN5949_c0_g1_i1.p1  ORF type:complete len:127 (+),score=7.49 TRINITY_DN5949_c0_g1_i1:282-662(+)